jgi:hypothetical protein
MERQILMKLPIVVVEPGDILFFRSLSIAERYLEPIDIRNNEYVAYDSEGRLLLLVLCEHTVKIELEEEEPTHADKLKEAVLAFFTEVGFATDLLSQASLEELILEGISNYETK